MSEEQLEKDPTCFFYEANIKLNLKKLNERVGGFSLEEVTPPVAEFEGRKEGEMLRVVEVNLLQGAMMHYQTVDDQNVVTNHARLIYLDFINDKAYDSTGSEIVSDLGVEVRKILSSAKGRYLTPSVPADKIQEHLLRSKQIFDHEGVSNV